MNATQQLGFGEIEPEETLSQWVTRDAEIEQIIKRDVAFLEGLDLLPSHYQLAYVDRGVLETGTWLRRKLQPIRDQYDLIIFDCPVHLGDLTRNALAASNGILVPTQPEKHSVLGLPHLTARAAEVFEETEVRNYWAYVLITMARPQTVDHQTWIRDVRAQYGSAGEGAGAVLNTLIRQNADLGKSATGGLPIVAYDDKCNGYQDYLAATEELLNLLTPLPRSLRVIGTDAAVN
jgi:chromosome partitioning protein